MDEVPLHQTFREFTPGHMALLQNEVHVFAERYLILDHRRRYAITHGALRVILSCYLGVDPSSLQFAFGPRGKPSLLDDGPQFNLSHSAQMAMVAVASAPIGIDCEKLRHLERLLDIAKRQFSAAEYAALKEVPEADRLLAFYRCWTRKEAYVKALGLGLAALDVFDVDLGERARLLALRDGQVLEDWSMLDISPSDGFVGACAVRLPRAHLLGYRLGEL